MQTKLRNELERLLEEGDKIGQVEKSPEAWEIQVRQLIYNYLGPKLDPPTNARAQEYYDCIFAKSHSAKIGILRNVLLLRPPNRIQKPANGNAQRKDKNDHKDETTSRTLDKTQIIVAIIGTIGVISAALITAWFAN